MLSRKDGTALIQTARVAIDDHLQGRDFKPTFRASSALLDQHGVFVTLFEHDTHTMRGCIGDPLPKTSVLQETSRLAVEAATMDPRFRPVKLEEFRRSIILELTVLSGLEQLVVKSPPALVRKIVVGRDGLLVDGVGARGLLLPQVAVDEGFDEEEFLNQCCLKAGLMPDAWLTGSVKVARFQGQIFSEDLPDGEVFERKLNRLVRKS